MLLLLMALPVAVNVGALVLGRDYAFGGLRELVTGETFAMCFAFAGSLVLHVHDLPSEDRSRVLVAGIAVDVTWVAARMWLGVPDPLLTFGRGMGAVAMIDRARRSIVSPSAEHVRRLFDMVMLPFSLLIAASVIRAIGDVTPQVIDGYLAPVEEATGATFAARVEVLFDAIPVLRALAYATYTAFALGLSIALVVNDEPARARFLRSLWVGSFLGFLVFVIAPAVGPRAFYVGVLDTDSLGGPPPSYLRFAALEAAADLPRNCIPSFHTAWAMMVALAVPRTRGWIALGIAWVVLTELATLGSGQHWVVDLALGIPVGVVMHAATLEVVAPKRLAAAALFVVIATGLWVAAHRLVGPALAAAPIATLSGFALTALSAVPLYRSLVVPAPA